MTMKLMQQYQADEVRAAAQRAPKRSPEGEEHYTSTWVEYGVIKRAVGTGRATCRCCGLKIARGAPTLTFPWDFHACGSWTATQATIHFDACQRQALERVTEAATPAQGHR